MSDPLRTFVGMTRLSIGLGAWFAPDLTVKVFGMNPDRSERFVTRLFGAREITMAGALLGAPPSALPAVAAFEAAIDGADVLSGLDEARRGNLGARATILGPVGAVVFVALNLLIAKRTPVSEST